MVHGHCSCSTTARLTDDRCFSESPIGGTIDIRKGEPSVCVRFRRGSLTLMKLFHVYLPSLFTSTSSTDKMKRLLVNLRNNIQQLLSKPGEQGDAGKQWCRSFGVFFLHLVLFISFCRKNNVPQKHRLSL